MSIFISHLNTIALIYKSNFIRSFKGVWIYKIMRKIKKTMFSFVSAEASQFHKVGTCIIKQK